MPTELRTRSDGELVSAAQSGTKSAFVEEEAVLVREHLAKLPEKYRMPLVLSPMTSSRAPLAGSLSMDLGRRPGVGPVSPPLDYSGS